MHTSVVGLAERVRGAALPIGGACERDRIARALADLGEVCKRGAGIIEESQRNPAGGELVLNSIVLPARHGGGARDAIRGLGVAEVEQRSRNKPPLDPPLVGVERLRRIVGDRQDQFGRFRRLPLATQPLGATEDIADSPRASAGTPSSCAFASAAFLMTATRAMAITGALPAARLAERKAASTSSA